MKVLQLEIVNGKSAKQEIFVDQDGLWLSKEQIFSLIQFHFFIC